MTRRTLLITWLVITALCSLFAYIFCCSSGSASSYSTYAVVGSNGFSADCGYGMFAKSDYQLIGGLEPNCMPEIAEYLKLNPEQSLNVEGFYTPQESNSSIYENLGLARAAQVKQKFVSEYDIPESQLSTSAKLVEDKAMEDDTLRQGYLLTVIKSKSTSPESSESIEEIILHFNTGSQEPNVDENIRHQFAKLLADLEAHPQDQLVVTGHTDTKGEAAANQTLGMQRAEQVKNYLVKNGINSTRITTQSMGETKPISDDDAENRRVTVTIKQ